MNEGLEKLLIPRNKNSEKPLLFEDGKDNPQTPNLKIMYDPETVQEDTHIYISRSAADKLIADMWLTCPPLYGIPISDIIIANDDLKDLMLNSIDDSHRGIYKTVNLLVIGARGRFYLVKDVDDQAVTGMIEARGYDMSKLTEDRLDEFLKSVEHGSVFIDIEK